MIILPVMVFVLMAIACWSALGCDALREFSYSRLEMLCAKRGVPERFGKILKQQGEVLLALEFMLTMSTLGLATILCCWIGWPQYSDADPWYSGPLEFLLKYAGFAVLAFIAADLLPWTIARVASEEYLCRFWPMIEGLQAILAPLLWIALQMDRYVHRLAGQSELESDDSSKIEEEIRSVVEEGEREGVLESGSTAMIQRVMQLQDEDVGAIITPRTEMDCMSADLTLEEARQQLIESGHSRIPVIGDSTDDVLGILYAKDLLKALEPARAGQSIPVLRDIIREPVFVPITTAIPSLLELMKREKVHITIVHDEYGGVAGLVTMEDILEEIVGEIADEYDDEQVGDDIKELDEKSVEVSARVRLDELNRRFDFDLPEDGEFDTIGGFVFAQKGSMPSTGESFRWQKLLFTIINADARVVKRLRIDRDVTSSNGTERRQETDAN
ncbi:MULTISPECIES: hemolysin family protein [unclassified Schlesneria]|uniref:hemolysin family protein n=1 Tax=Schlesneria TaxID=656899 RepID=UPI002F186021